MAVFMAGATELIMSFAHRRACMGVRMSTGMRSIAACVIVLACTMIAQAKPNFSGRWKMNASQSEFGAITLPSSLVLQITHNDPDLKVITTQAGEMGDFEIELSYTTDGRECVNRVRDIERKSTVRWDGDTLVIESRMDLGGNAVTVIEKWNLSADGKTLTSTRLLKGPEGETTVKTVMDRQ